MKTLKNFFSQHLIALSLAALGALGLVGSAVSAAPVAAAGKCTTVSCVQQFGDQQIDARLDALNKLNDDAQNHKGLTDQQRQVIEGDVSTNENGLRALRKQLDGETDIKAALTDVKNIYVQFRIYAVVLPRDYGEIELFFEQNIITRMTDANQTITDLIQKAKDKGDDVTQLLALQADYNAKLADATSNTNNAQGLIPGLTPANYPGTDQTLKTYHTDLKNARTDIAAAAKDLHQMLQILKQDLGNS
jgi:hypothetical protein